MMSREEFLEGLSRCDIFFEKEKISTVSTVKEAVNFFASAFYETTTRRRTFLHTGSVAYDAVAVLLSALADILVFYVKNEEFLANLRPGDIVMDTQYGKRLRREVKEVILNKSIKLLENPKTNRLYTMPWSKTRYLEPNRGTGRQIGGVGLQQSGSRAREKFFEYAFGMSPEDLPRTSKSYTVIVASHEYAHRIFRGIEIEVRNNAGQLARISLSDIAGGIYVTQDQNITLGGDLSNDESVLRFCSSLTLAKEKINEASGDRIASLLVISDEALMAGDAAVFNRLSSMRRKNFVFTSIAVSSLAVDSAIQNVGEDGKLLAHTKHYLRKLLQTQVPGGVVVREMWSQARSLVRKNIYIEKVDGFLTVDQYAEWLASVKAFKNVSFEWETKASFLDEACGLFSFLKGSVFEMADLDKRTDLVWRGRKLSPASRIADLIETSSKYPAEVRVFSDKVISIIKTVYDRLKVENKKMAVLERIISEHQGRRIAIVVPQGGFNVIFEELGYYERIRSLGGMLTISTPNSFGRGTSQNRQTRYDIVLSLGGGEGRRFSPFSCAQANEMHVILYSVEAKNFGDRVKNSIRKERVLNNQSTYSDYAVSIENSRSAMCEDDSRFEMELAAFLKDFREREDQRLAERYGRLSGANRNVEIVKIGTFDSGEKIFFTKFFRPYVMDEGDGALKEVELDEVAIGDTLLFTQNNDASKDIVDVMLNDYIDMQSEAGRQRLIESLAKTRRWRQLLRTYSINRQLSAADIAERMKMTGSTVHEVTVRNWMDEESHLVGPRNKTSLEHIAKLTGDRDLQEHINDYFEACRIIREQRVKLLHELGMQIKRGLTTEKTVGKGNASIAAKVKDMVRLCVLDNLIDAPDNLSMNAVYVNRPITNDTKAGV